MTRTDGIDQIHALRVEELRRVLQRYARWFYGKDLLEIGSGTGLQLKTLSSICRSSFGLELVDSAYKVYRIADIRDSAEIRDYDGKSIPFADNSFDVIFSSHVLEHLKEEKELYKEMQRVLRPGGAAIHVVPSHAWRFWASLMHYPAMAKLLIQKLLPPPNAIAPVSKLLEKKPTLARVRQMVLNGLIPRRHGESGNLFTEHFLLHPLSWRRRLARHGWAVERIDPIGLWYSGHLLVGDWLSMRSRTKLARMLGSTTFVILARPAVHAI